MASSTPIHLPPKVGKGGALGGDSLSLAHLSCASAIRDTAVPREERPPGTLSAARRATGMPGGVHMLPSGASQYAGEQGERASVASKRVCE